MANLKGQIPNKSVIVAGFLEGATRTWQRPKWPTLFTHRINLSWTKANPASRMQFTELMLQRVAIKAWRTWPGVCLNWLSF